MQLLNFCQKRTMLWFFILNHWLPFYRIEIQTYVLKVRSMAQNAPQGIVNSRAYQEASGSPLSPRLSTLGYKGPTNYFCIGSHKFKGWFWRGESFTTCVTSADDLLPPATYSVRGMGLFTSPSFTPWRQGDLLANPAGNDCI